MINHKHVWRHDGLLHDIIEGRIRTSQQEEEDTRSP